MLNAILILYAIILLTFVAMYFFIVYHLAKFSINTRLNRLMLPFFIFVSTVLLFSNIFFFFRVDWQSLLETLFIY